jgi:16S rRNA (cytosine967-C5)-methyltransferase
VLLDVPCSGLGTARLNPDVKWTRVESDLAGFGGAQLTMLTQAAEVVKPGGRLVYATCSSEPEENEQVVEQFLSRDSRFALSPPSLPPAVREPGLLVDARGHLRTLPWSHGLDAFFAATLVRRAGA